MSYCDWRNPRRPVNDHAAALVIRSSRMAHIVHRHIALSRRPRRPGIDLAAAFDAVSPSVRDATRELSRLGIRHALVGGVAVGAHGFPRATKIVEFLVGEEAFEHHGAIVT